MISYWDTSALIPCFLTEASTSLVRGWLKSEEEAARFTSWVTAFEFETVLKRKLQQKHINLDEYQNVQERWMSFQKTLNWVTVDERASRLGLRIQKIYGLWTGGSAQLGCASLLQVEYPKMRFVCLDRKLSHAAEQEGFEIP